MNHPDTLWHYTDLAGLHGIITSGALRFGDSRFLNDRTERAYGLGVLKDALTHYAGQYDLQDLLRQTENILPVAARLIHLYLCSLSETCESVSQWQRHGAEGRGYCIGLDVSSFPKAVIDEWNIKLHRMVYDAEEQRKIVQEHLARIAQAWDHDTKMTSRDRDDWIAIYASMCAVQLEKLILLFKNPQLADEREWRLIVEVKQGGIDASLRPVAFSVGRDYVRPHIDVVLGTAVAGRGPRLPIRSVVCGPGLDQDMAADSIEYFLRRQGYADIRIEKSELHGAWR